MKNDISLIGIIIFCLISRVEAQLPANTDANFPYKNMPAVMPGTNALTWDGDLSVKMLDGAHKFIDAKIDESIVNRLKFWNRNFSSMEAYELSVEPNRRRFMKCIGVEDKNEPLINYDTGLEDKNPTVSMQRIAINNDPELIAETSKYRVYQVRWPVLNRINGEGLFLQPKTKPLANIIAIPDADQTPEQLAGLSPGIAVKSQFVSQRMDSRY